MSQSPGFSKNPWQKPLDASVLGGLRGVMTQQTDGKTIILRPRPLPWRQKDDQPTFLPDQFTTTTTTTSSTTPPPTFDVTLENGSGGASTTFDTTTTGTSIVIMGVAPGVYNISTTASVGFTFNGWVVTGGAIVTDPFNAVTTVTVSATCDIASAFTEDP